MCTRTGALEKIRTGLAELAAMDVVDLPDQQVRDQVHEGNWSIRLDVATGEVHVTRPDGRPYELGPSLPWTSSSIRGPSTRGPTTRQPATDPDPPAAAA